MEDFSERERERVIIFPHIYDNIISVDNLLCSWLEFLGGKRKRKDVSEFALHLGDNILRLHQELKNKTYAHGGYFAFRITDPKQRNIHKASVRDRLLHHAIYRILYPSFDKKFISDSYSCRIDKGVHKGVKRLKKFTRIVSKNYTQPCFVLKCDIKKFFASVNHEILLSLLKKRIADENILWLLENVINSFESEPGSNKGIPLGNLTSQLFANIYMNELDQFVKHKMKIKYYLRYADDFAFVLQDKAYLLHLINPIQEFLKTQLGLELHPKKIILRRFEQGIDFLGYIVLPHYILPRTKTKRRIYKKLQEKIGSENFDKSLQSYLGYLSHANSYKVQKKLIKLI